MSKEELLARLKALGTWERDWRDLHGDPEADHGEAEDALLDFIGDDEIRAAWKHLSDRWWYA